MTGLVEVVIFLPPERIQQRTAEEMVDVPIPRIQEQNVGVVKVKVQERVSERILQQTAGGWAGATDHAGIHGVHRCVLSFSHDREC